MAVATMAHRLILVDDHPIVLDGLADLFDSQDDLEVVGRAPDSATALRLLGEVEADGLVVDLRLQGQSGLELIKDVVSRKPGVRILALTMREEDLYAERALRAGAQGFLNKSASPTEILVGLRSVLDGNIHVSPRMSSRLFDRFVSRSSEESAIESPINLLSDRELEVYEAIGSGMSTHEIAAKLTLSPKTVESYREKIKAKLKLGSGSELVRHATLWFFEKF